MQLKYSSHSPSVPFRLRGATVINQYHFSHTWLSFYHIPLRFTITSIAKLHKVFLVEPLPKVSDQFAAFLPSLGLLLLCLFLWDLVQQALSEQSRAPTAFITPVGLFEGRVLPFGLKNSPAEFQRIMDVVLYLQAASGVRLLTAVRPEGSGIEGCTSKFLGGRQLPAKIPACTCTNSRGTE
eukprot:GHVS01089768.1.p1 GENE.GHVS01089768.1~~GHVS01089768.1.p1  ORF type:complete len:181 (-),score=8.05 GHVS01089768.1:57-599(-)